MDSTKKLLATTAISIGLSAVSAGSAQAIAINRSDFDASATIVDFENISLNSTTVSSGNLTVNGGSVNNVSSIVNANLLPLSGNNYSDQSQIQFNQLGQITRLIPIGIYLQFSNSVSAVGFDFVLQNTGGIGSNSVTLRLYDSDNIELEASTISLVRNSTNLYSGYLGLNRNSDLIARATITSGVANGELFIDNIIYQSSNTIPVPEPLSLGSILGGGFLLWIKHKQKSKLLNKDNYI